MPRAEIIAIGTELLLGEIQDTNTAYLARQLRDAGIDLYRATLIGDNPERICSSIREALNRAEIVITTGGLGPTVDDPTRQAVADALGVGIEYRPDLWEQIEDRFTRFNRRATENNRKQAYIPAGAVPLENPVGTAPAFIAEVSTGVVISLPGVPREMEYLFTHAVLPYLRQHFHLQAVIQSFILHTAGIGESQVDELIGDLEQLSNPTVGLAAHSGQIDIRITAKAPTVDAANQMIQPIAQQVIARLGESVYGAGNITLPELLVSHIHEIGSSLVVVECGLQGALSAMLSSVSSQVSIFFQAVDQCPADGLEAILSQVLEFRAAKYGLAANLQADGPRHVLQLDWKTGNDQISITRSYGGPPQNSVIWAANTAMDFVRRNLSIPIRLLNDKG